MNRSISAAAGSTAEATSPVLCDRCAVAPAVAVRVPEALADPGPSVAVPGASGPARVREASSAAVSEAFRLAERRPFGVFEAGFEPAVSERARVAG
jgi:hypothetical protein